MKNRFLLLMLLSAIFAPQVFAWGPTGHRVVAEVAQRHLTPTAREQITQLLGGHTLAEVVNWPDELRSERRFDKYKPLHFATVPNGKKSYRDTTPNPCGDLVTAIDALTAYLTTGSHDDLFKVKALTDKSDGNDKNGCNREQTEPITRETALRMLVHFMGDLHQPLHVGGADLGGNVVKVSWMGRWQTNLHSVWDDDMVDFERLSYTEYASYLDHVSEEDVTRWQAGDTIAWADEAVAMRPALYVFPDDKKPPVVPHLVSYGYTAAQRDRMREQLLKGGLRLASVLNKIFK